MRKTRNPVLRSLALTNEDFATFYRQYPRHDAPTDAERAFNRVITEGATLAEILLGLASYPFEFKQDGRFLPLPATWLRRGSWRHVKTVIPLHARSDEKSRSGWRDKFDGGVQPWQPRLYAGPMIEGAVGDD
jgi:hypothetical protein